MNAKINDKVNSRGWEALKILLLQRGLAEPELEEARDSFYKGAKLLAELLLCCYLPETSDGKSSKLFDDLLQECLIFLIRIRNKYDPSQCELKYDGEDKIVNIISVYQQTNSDLDKKSF